MDAFRSTADVRDNYNGTSGDQSARITGIHSEKVDVYASPLLPLASLLNDHFHQDNINDIRILPNDNNMIHFSTSAFEAMYERIVWLQYTIPIDPFGADLLAAGIPLHFISSWIQTANTVEGKDIFQNFSGRGGQDCIQAASLLVEEGT